MNSPARKFQDLLVWRKAHQLVLRVYQATAEFPKSELYGLTSQFRRAAVSIPAISPKVLENSAKPIKFRFMNIAQGSLEEARYYMILAKDLEYGDMIAVSALADEVSKLLEAYAAAIMNDIKLQ